uniref:Helitron helicase-like domain-containing protein n=1 Tax=Romanomermis culicivorax TaxID=13658 RepID=A0A915HLC4_ROMCU
MESVRNNGSQCDISHSDEEITEQSPEALCPQTSQVQGEQVIQPNFSKKFAEVMSKAGMVRKREVLLTMRNRKIPPELLDQADKAIAEVARQNLDCLPLLNMAVYSAAKTLQEILSGEKRDTKAQWRQERASPRKMFISEIAWLILTIKKLSEGTPLRPSQQRGYKTLKLKCGKKYKFRLRTRDLGQMRVLLHDLRQHLGKSQWIEQTQKAEMKRQHTCPGCLQFGLDTTCNRVTGDQQQDQDLVTVKIMEMEDIVEIGKITETTDPEWSGICQLVELHPVTKFLETGNSCRQKNYLDDFCGSLSMNLKMGYFHSGGFDLKCKFCGAKLLKSEQFLKKARQYNNEFAFGSVNVKTEPPPRGGIPVCKINGETSYKLSDLIPRQNQRPVFGQMYALELGVGKQERVSHENENLKKPILEGIEDCLREHNVLAKICRWAKQVYEQTVEEAQRVEKVEQSEAAIAIEAGKGGKAMLEEEARYDADLDLAKDEGLEEIETNLRSKLPAKFFEALAKKPLERGNTLGKVHLCPPLWMGSRAYMAQQYAESRAVERELDGPTWFLNLTGNPKRPEITEFLETGQPWTSRPDVGHNIAYVKLTENTKQEDYDKIALHFKVRYMAIMEAFWRMYSFPICHRSQTVIRQWVYGPQGMPIIFHEGYERKAQGEASSGGRTTLVQAFFDLCQNDTFARTLM